MNVKIKRIYEPYSENDGFRILIDRLWPRGMNKEKAHIDKWVKEVAPSTALRKWFNHEPYKWDQFRIKYHSELNSSSALKELFPYINENKTVTLLFGSKEEKYNHAIVLQQFITDHFSYILGKFDLMRSYIVLNGFYYLFNSLCCTISITASL
jgi:uncharacterized protein YeaO (DUF488 family)